MPKGELEGAQIELQEGSDATRRQRQKAKAGSIQWGW
jgi:hypothetical protein